MTPTPQPTPQTTMGMANPKTTITGYVLMSLGIAYFLVHLYQGTASLVDIQSLVPLASGLGLITAKDGGY